MRYLEYATVAGKTIITQFTFSTPRKKGERRSKRQNASPEKMVMVNRANREYNLTADLNCNFGPGDYDIVLEELPGTTYKEGEVNLAKFKRKIRDYCNKHNLSFLCISATGRGENAHNLDHHIVLNKDVPFDVILSAWRISTVHVDHLDDSGNYRRHANYLLKNADQTASERPKGSKAYLTSRQIVHPERRKKTLRRIPFRIIDPEDIRPRKGYAVDKDSIRIYTHPITECPCVYYIEYALTDTPRINKSSLGKRVPRDSIMRE